MPAVNLNTPIPRGYPAARPANAADAKVKPQVRTMVRYGLFLYFLMVLLEGVFRKWLLPDLNQLIYIAKDAILALVCARVIVSLGYIPIPRTLRHSKVGHLFIAFAVYSLCQGFNPRLPNTILGAWGIRTYVLPMSLAYLVPLAMPDPRMNERYFRRYLLLGIPIALLCLAQYQLPPNHLVNKYSNAELGESVAVVGDAVRVSGPFSYITGLTTYIAFQLAGVFGVLFASGWKWRGNKLLWLAFLLAVIVVPMTGSRALVAFSLLYLGILLALDSVLKQGAGGQSRMLISFICVAAISIGFFGEAFDRLSERARTAGDTESRLYSIFIKPIEFFDQAGLFGYGAAATHQAAPVLVPGGASYYWLPKIYFEDESGRVMLEMGAFGFVLYVVLKVAICFQVFNYIRNFGRAVPLTIPVACLLTATSCMITGMIFNSVGSSFYWGVFGLFVAQANATRVVAATR